MAEQPSYEPLRKSDFFDDQRAARPLVEGTVARGQLREDEQFYTGKIGGEPAETFPFPVDRQVLLRGQERFDIFCSPCHDRVGNGQGMIVRRGYRPPPSLHIDRLREARAGPFLRRDVARLRHHAGLCRADPPRGSLGDRRLHPRAAAEPERALDRRARERAAPGCVESKK